MKNVLQALKAQVRLWLMLICCLPQLLFAHDQHEGGAYFVPNKGQFPAEVLAQLDLPALRIFVLKDGFTWLSSSANDLNAIHKGNHPTNLVRQHAWKTHFEGSSFTGVIAWEEVQPFELNYFIGQDPSRWASAIRPYKIMVLKDFYPGIDLRLDAHAGFKYEFHVQPGANPALVRASIQGLQTELMPDGRLHYPAQTSSYFELPPKAWNETTAGPLQVDIAFESHPKGWHFRLGPYQAEYKLVLDPTLVASTYTGSNTSNWGFTATYDSAENIYLGGINFNPGYPTTLGAFQTVFGGDVDMTISKFSATGSALLYSTYIGGAGADYALSLVVNAANNLFILGKSNSTNFPTTVSAYDRTHNGGYDLVVSRLSAAGSVLVGSTYIGGSADESQNNGNNARYNLSALEFNYGDDGRGEVLIDQQGNVLVASNTNSANFPTVNAAQALFGGVQDGVLIKLNPGLTSLLYSTFLGGSGMDAAYGVKSAGGDTVLVTGSTFSANFPIATLTSGFQRTQQGASDGFLVRLRTSAGPLLSGTFLGTSSYDQSYLIDTDVSGKVYVLGISFGNFPVLPTGIYQVPNSRHFIQRYSPDLNTLELSTAFGVANAAGPALSPTAFLVDVCGKIYVTGWGGSTNFGRNAFTSPMNNLPTTSNGLQTVTDGSDMYIAVFEANMQSLLYATFFGGSASDEHVDGGTCRFSKEGVIYHAVCAGCGGNSDFPTTPGAWSATNNASSGLGSCNAAVFKIDLEYVNPVAQFTTQYLDTSVCLNTPVQFRPTATQVGDFYWSFGIPGATSTLPSPVFTYTSPGTYQVQLIIVTCFGADTILQNIVVQPLPTVQIDQIGAACPGDTVVLRASGGQQYRWQADSTLSNANTNEARVLASSSRWYVVSVTDTRGCVATDSIFLNVIEPTSPFRGINATWCYGDTLQLDPAQAAGFSAYNWLPDVDITDPSRWQQSFSSLPSRWVYLLLTDTAGCSYIDSIRLNPEVRVQANGGPDRYVCNDDTITLRATGGTRYLWSTGDTTASIRATTATQASFWVIAYLGTCRSLADTVVLTNATVAADFIFSPDTGYAPQLVNFTNLSSAVNQSRFLWDFGDGTGSSEPNPQHIYRAPGAYRVRLQVLNFVTGCSDSLIYEFVIIDSIQILLPNAFTPNGDGVNDVFKGVIRNFADFDFLVYDRWGSLVYNANTENFSWDGTQNGEALPPGVYPYVLKARGKNGRPYNRTGQIVLIR
ncbi:MAG: gliding motility-associated C-terminal domain-containing protein [Sphingobacteriaceae bacterium]|nr:gliding motility-associated C-terminal domain-containing protein [Sphingobacteriaceae bacterium]